MQLFFLHWSMWENHVIQFHYKSHLTPILFFLGIKSQTYFSH
uniref:Uncharacterized protein n=1 Tax=Rhizophora mucronata TaxID=61149 RepID=A0A2P2IKG0_RHIMU